MTDAFSLVLDDQELLERLDEISRRVSDMTPAMRAIGELLTESTKQRFTDSEGPDGKRWAPLAPATVLSRLAEISGYFTAYSNLKTGKTGRIRVGDKKGYYRKDGRIGAKGASAVANMKPLIDSGILQDTISYQVISDGNGVEIGTNRFSGEWDGGAAVHHFGSRDGSIPARPFLGVSEDDRVALLDVLSRFIDQSN